MTNETSNSGHNPAFVCRARQAPKPIEDTSVCYTHPMRWHHIHNPIDTARLYDLYNPLHPESRPRSPSSSKPQPRSKNILTPLITTIPFPNPNTTRSSNPSSNRHPQDVLPNNKNLQLRAQHHQPSSRVRPRSALRQHRTVRRE